MSKCTVCHYTDLADNARTDICTGCKSSRRYWRRPEKGVHAIIERAKQLKRWEDRMVWISHEEVGYSSVRRAFKKLRSEDHS